MRGADDKNDKGRCREDEDGAKAEAAPAHTKREQLLNLMVGSEEEDLNELLV